MNRAGQLLSVAAALVLSASGLFFLWPAGELVLALRDPALGGPAPAGQAARWHRALTPAFVDWAGDRLMRKQATTLSMHDISGTEWPLFSAMYYLRATDNLQAAWLKEPEGDPPAQYARAAVDAAAALLADPAQAHWVKLHWGADRYLSQENVFYRMLVIDGLASQWRILGSTPHRQLLHDQVTGLAAELTAAETGLLADYPGQTFPADVAAAWHAILRADPLLGTDHRDQVREGVRGFTGAMALGGDLPPYAWFGEAPPRATTVRGSANSWLLHHAPFLWPDQARAWMSAHEREHWQADPWLSGFREFRSGDPSAGEGDVDSGPIFLGRGTAASAFGVGAARSAGRSDLARPLALQAVAAAWPLPNGRLLVPWLLSDRRHAALLGESAMLYNFTQPAATGMATVERGLAGATPRVVWMVLALQVLVGLALLVAAARALRRAGAARSRGRP